MSEPKPAQATPTVPYESDATETVDFLGIDVFVDVVAEPSSKPIPPAVQEWIRQHQYLLQPRKKEDKDEKK
jgi:hypothetical protein